MTKTIRELELALKIQGVKLHVNRFGKMQLQTRAIGEVSSYARNSLGEVREVMGRPFFEGDVVTDYQFSHFVGATPA